MERRKFLQNSGLALGLLTLAQNKSMAKFLSQNTYNFKLLRNDVGIFSEKGGTIGWLNSTDGFTVVDAQFPDTAINLITELKKLKEQPFEYLINTHHHGDHSGGNIAFKDLAKNVVAHENSLINQKKATQKVPEKQLYPDTTFANKMSLKCGNEKIKLHYFGAAHTNGDVIVHFENTNIVHLGDLVFNRRYPYIDKANGANITNWIEVLAKVLNKFDKDTLFIFGHALEPEKITGNKADITAFKDYLSKLTDFVKTEIAKGTSKEQILAAKIIPGVTEWKGDGIIRSLDAAYQEFF